MNSTSTLSPLDLNDYLRSAEGIHTMFERLGYDVYEPESIDIEDLELLEADAEYVNQVYVLNDS